MVDILITLWIPLVDIADSVTISLIKVNSPDEQTALPRASSQVRKPSNTSAMAFRNGTAHHGTCSIHRYLVVGLPREQTSL